MKCILLELRLNDGNGGYNAFRITSAPFDIIYNGSTFTATGELLDIDKLEESTELTTRGLTITLNGIDPSYRQEIESNGFIKAPIDILLANVPDGTNVPNVATFYHRGYADSPYVDTDLERGVMTLQVETKSIFTDIDRVADLMRCSMASHQSRHSGDRFFEYTADVDIEEIWKVPEE